MFKIKGNMMLTLLLALAIPIQFGAPEAFAEAEQSAETKASNTPPRLHGLISDNMVMQQGVEIPIWGWAEPGEKITVTIRGSKAIATADAKGAWTAKIAPLKAGGPFEMHVRGNTSETIVRNILVGEVWLGSGQSNMAMTVGKPGAEGAVTDIERETAEANYPEIRMFTVDHITSSKPMDNVQGKWIVCTPQTVGDFSATLYFFGRDLHKSLKVPVGLINASWGMLMGQSFISRQGIASDPNTKGAIEQDQKGTEKFLADFDGFIEKLRGWDQIASRAEAEGKPMPTFPPTPSDPRPSPFRMSNVYNAMIGPLAPYPIRGAIWYQGESNTIAPDQYYNFLVSLVQDWRRTWSEDLVFLVVQLPNFDAKPGGYTTVESWPKLRESQARAIAATPRTGLAVTIDVGDPVNIHPPRKQPVGRRLALAAEGIAYGRKIEYSGPVYDSMSAEGDAVRLRFQHVGGGLRAKDHAGNLTIEAPLNTFVIAGADGKFVPANAKIEGETILVHSGQVKAPTAVRYAWFSNPEGCNLYSAAGLPASPFRTDGPKQ